MFSDGQFAGWIGQKYDNMANQTAIQGREADIHGREADTHQQEAVANAKLSAALGNKANSEADVNKWRTSQASDPARAALYRQLYGSSGPYGSDGAPMAPGQSGPGGVVPGDATAPDGTHRHYDALGGEIITLPQGPATGSDPFSHPLTSRPVPGDPDYHAKGTAAVRQPGRGMVAMRPKGTDTVPAMLTPGEAVLNHHAAEMIGRDKIAAANAIGNHMAQQAGPQGGPPAGKPAPGKGMTPAKGKARPGAPHDLCAGSSRVPGYAEGTDNVPGINWESYHDMNAHTLGVNGIRAGGNSPDTNRDALAKAAKIPMPQDFSKGTHMVGHGKSAKTPAKLDPAALVGLLGAMRGGGGGMMQPGGAPPPMMG